MTAVWKWPVTASGQIRRFRSPRRDLASVLPVGDTHITPLSCARSVPAPDGRASLRPTGALRTPGMLCDALHSPRGLVAQSPTRHERNVRASILDPHSVPVWSASGDRACAEVGGAVNTSSLQAPPTVLTFVVGGRMRRHMRVRTYVEHSLHRALYVRSASHLGDLHVCLRQDPGLNTEDDRAASHWTLHSLPCPFVCAQGRPS
ncbi:hypothetical protein C8Q77DRAFT_653495 [Trametes polyzona]|nr:hypothetical protein C8Q77DRAFT_653495 [Trametes polyzona]